MEIDIQFCTKEEILTYQNNKLRENFLYVLNNSPYYKKKFKEMGISSNEINSLSDLKKLPLTTKKDLQLYNDDFIAVDKDDIIDCVTTSGTLGDAVVFALNDEDLKRLAKNEKQSFTIAGLGKSDKIQLMTTMDKRFMAGLAYFLGARELSASIIRVGNAVPELHWDTIRKVQPNVAIVVPSFIVKLIEFAKAKGIDYRNSSLKKAICIGESVRNLDGSLNTLASYIKEQWAELELYSTYASTEMQTSITECSCHDYSHTQPDLVIVELLDDNDEEVKEGEVGEVTITTLGIKAMPLIRFKTGDLCVAKTSQCSCGRNTMRLSPIVGRKSQMLKYKGTSLYPSSFFEVLNNVREIKNYIVEAYTGDLGTDQVLVRIVSLRQDDVFEKELKNLFKAKIRVTPQIVFDSDENLLKKQMPEKNRKIIRFIDLRGEGI